MSDPDLSDLVAQQAAIAAQLAAHDHEVLRVVQTRIGAVREALTALEAEVGRLADPARKAALDGFAGSRLGQTVTRVLDTADRLTDAYLRATAPADEAEAD